MGKLRGIRGLITFCAVLALASAVAPAAAQDATFYEHLDYSGASFSAQGDVSFVGWDWNNEVNKVLTDVWSGNIPIDQACAAATEAGNAALAKRSQ